MMDQNKYSSGKVRFPGHSPSAFYPSQIFWWTFHNQTNAYLDFHSSHLTHHCVLPIRKIPYLDLYPSQFCPYIGGFLPITIFGVREQLIRPGKTKNSPKNSKLQQFIYNFHTQSPNTLLHNYVNIASREISKITYYSSKSITPWLMADEKCANNYYPVNIVCKGLVP